MKKQPKIRTKKLVIKTNVKAGPQDIRTLEPLGGIEAEACDVINPEPLSTAIGLKGW